jgi:septal ring factor EnvC (AmiA/AmiB activator)
MTSRRRKAQRLGIAAFAAAAACAALPGSSGADPSLGDLSSQLNEQQAHEHSLSASIAGLSRTIASLDGQIALVRGREAEVRAELARDRIELARTRKLLARERRLVKVLRARLARARMVLARQLVSNYENDKPDLVGVVLDANGFNDLLERIDFLRRAEGAQQTIIKVTRADKAAADAAEMRLAGTEAADERIAQGAALRVKALAVMNALLQSKEGALHHAREAQLMALAATRTRGSRLRTEIANVRAQEAAAAPPGPTSTRSPASSPSSAPSSGRAPAAASGPAPAPSGGFTIPNQIVTCESGGQNLPPNSAGASGYYQIMPGTWRQYGGTGSAAYRAPKSEQDAVAHRIWQGSGPSAWVCAGVVGIT